MSTQHIISFRIPKRSQHRSHHLSRAWRAWHWKEPCFILSPPPPTLPPAHLTNNRVHSLWSLVPVSFRFPVSIWSLTSYTVSQFLSNDDGGDSIWGSKDFQVPEYFNFVDLLDEWAYKEKVRRYCSWKKVLILVSDQKAISTLDVL